MTDFEALGPAWQLFRRSEQAHVPLSMTLELTRRCHLHCVHCYLDETQTPNDPAKLRSMRSRELSAGEWASVFEQLAELGGMYVVLSGGEVFLRPDFLEIAREARARAFNVRVFTTAMHVDEGKASALAELGVERVEVSLYGGREAHARVTGEPAAFDRSVRGLRLLKRAGLAVTIKAPLMTLNAADRHWLLDFAEELGALCKFDPTVVPRNSGRKDNLALRLGPEALDEVFADERTVTPESLENPGPGVFQDGEYKDFLCSAGRNSGAMDPYGNVYPCLQWLRVAGNVRERPLAEIWNDSPVLREIRAFKHEAESCGTGSYCNNCPGMAELENGDPLKPTIFDRTLQDRERDAKARLGARRLDA